MSRTIDTLSAHVDDADARYEVYMELIEAFRDADCDTLDECAGVDVVFDAALEDMFSREAEDLANDLVGSGW